MRILVICQYYYPEPFKIHEICEELARRGNEVTVITGRPNYPDGKLIKGYEMNDCLNDVKIIRTKIALRGNHHLSLIRNYFDYPRKAIKEIDKLDKEYDVVFVYQLTPVLMIKPALYYKQRYNKKVIVYCLDLWPESLKALRLKENNPLYKTMLKVSNNIYKKCDHIVVSSPSFINYLQDVNMVSRDKLSVVYQHGEKMFLSIKSYKKQDKLNIVFAGNIGKVQDFECLLKAVSLIPSSLLEHLLITIIGSGSYLRAFQDSVKKAKLNNIFNFVGRKKVEELKEYFEHASVFLLSLEKGSSVSKTVPSKLQTYMAAGRGIIGSIDGSTAEIIKKASAGITCDAGDYKQLSKIIQMLIQNDECLIDFARNSRNYFLQNFTIEKYCDELIKKLKDSNETELREGTYAEY